MGTQDHEWSDEERTDQADCAAARPDAAMGAEPVAEHPADDRCDGPDDPEGAGQRASQASRNVPDLDQIEIKPVVEKGREVAAEKVARREHDDLAVCEHPSDLASPPTMPGHGAVA